MPTILIIDDNASVTLALEVLFSLHGIHTLSASSPEQGLAILAEHAIDLVMQDMNFSQDTTSGQEGQALFAAIRTRYAHLPVILMTAWTQLETAVELVKAGAADYLAKPWDDQRLLTSVRNLLALGQAQRDLHMRTQREAQSKSKLETHYDLDGLVWQDPATEKALSIACQVARSPVPIFISGPNGAGKERIARIIQKNSNLAQAPFITLNCGALPTDLIEAELFGSEAGAYTGANKARIGRFEAADGGTLFLDEIGNLPLQGQVKLLRVLETGRFSRLGSHLERQVQVRVISATNADLPALIRAQLFREDLYYRLNVIEVALPSLAERPGDILPLAEFFLAGTKCLSPEARQVLQQHSWPGNVRELKNLMHRVQLLVQGEQVQAQDLGLAVCTLAKTLTNSAHEPSRAEIEHALVAAQGVVARAAQELGLSRQSLYRRMERLGIARHA